MGGCVIDLRFNFKPWQFSDRPYCLSMIDTFADMRTDLPIRMCTPYKIGKSNKDYFWETAIIFHSRKQTIHGHDITPGTQCILRVQTKKDLKYEKALQDPLISLNVGNITESQRTYLKKNFERFETPKNSAKKVFAHDGSDSPLSQMRQKVEDEIYDRIRLPEIAMRTYLHRMGPLQGPCLPLDDAKQWLSGTVEPTPQEIPHMMEFLESPFNVGDKVSAKFSDGHWYRATVAGLNYHDVNSIKVRGAHGETEDIHPSNVKPLRR